MKRMILATATITLALVATTALASSTGKKLFAQHCAVCHKDGGNIINPTKTLHRGVLEKNGVKSWKDIVGKMRTPGPGMTKFDKKTVSDHEAKEIAEYVLKSFK